MCRWILDGLDLEPHKVRGWLNRRDDPEFWGRVRDVCGLYSNEPDNAIVVSVDEKTAIGAKERVALTSPASPGKPSRYELEYRRHGTASLLAALEVHSGEVLAADIAKNDSPTFTAFLEDIDRSVDPSLQVRLVMDNGSSHTAKATKAWFGQHPRAPSLCRSLHPRACELGQPGRTVLLDHHPQSAEERQLPLA